MKKNLILLVLSGVIFLLNTNFASASESWIGGYKDYDYYVLDESIKLEKNGAYYAEVKEVHPNNTYTYGLFLYKGANGSIMYYKTGTNPAEARQAKFLDFPYLIYNHIEAHFKKNSAVTSVQSSEINSATTAIPNGYQRAFRVASDFYRDGSGVDIYIDYSNIQDATTTYNNSKYIRYIVPVMMRKYTTGKEKYWKYMFSNMPSNDTSEMSV